MPMLGTDAEGVDRAGIHRNLISEAGLFFRHALGQPNHGIGQTPGR